jgi:hypothetical protein
MQNAADLNGCPLPDEGGNLEHFISPRIGQGTIRILLFRLGFAVLD